MGKRLSPRSGSMGVWPRKRATRQYARIRAWGDGKGLLAFPAYKAGMTHVMAIDTRKTAPTKGETLSLPSTVFECPPIKLYTVRCYTTAPEGKRVVKEVVLGKEKQPRKIFTKKTNEAELANINPADYTDITVTILTQPSKTGFGKKKAEIFESALGGTNEEKLEWVKAHINMEIPATEVFKEGDYADAHGITTGRGFQGPVKRFGISLKPAKSEKGRRAPGSLGPWKGQQHFMYRVAHAGQTGYHQRVQYNNMILKMGDNPEDVNPRGGFINFGEVRSSYMIVKGSIPGPKKRMITFTKPIRLYAKKTHPLPTVEMISLESKQR